MTINEEAKTKFSLDAIRDEKVKIVVENSNIIQTVELDLKVIPKAVVKVTSFSPDEVTYSEENYLEFNLNANTLVKEVTISIEGIGKIELEDFEGDYLVEVPFRGNMINDGNVVLDMHYKDILNNEYKDRKNYSIKITKMPFYAYIIKFFKDMFYIQ